MAGYSYNEDHASCAGGANYNLIHSIEDIPEGGGNITEPVPLQEMKDYLRLEGWDESGEFDFDDSLVSSLITSGRMFCEAKTGCSLIPKSITAYITNGCGMISLPAGPVTGTVSIESENGQAIDSANIKLIGNKFPQLKTPTGANMVVTYNAGYNSIDSSGESDNNIPEGLRNAIKAYVAEAYENRGDELSNDPVFKRASKLCSPFVKYGPYA